MQRQRSRRRIRTRFSTALYSVAGNPAAQRQRQFKPAKTNVPAPSTSRRPHPREPQLGLTPSTLWSSLPLALRIIVLLTGFFAVYYLLFAKHQSYDRRFRKMKEIRRDLEEILRKANESGFMNQNMTEALLPAIFLEVNDSQSQANGTHSELTESLVANNEDNKTTQVEQSFKPTSGPPDKTVKKKKTKKEKKSRRKLKSRSHPGRSHSDSAESHELEYPAETSSINSLPSDASTQNASNPLAANQTSEQTSSQSRNQTTPEEPIQISTESAGFAALLQKTLDSSAKDSTTDVSSPVHSRTSPTPLGSAHSTVMQTPKPIVQTSLTTPSGTKKYPIPTKNLGLEGEKGPNRFLLHWNLEAIINESTSEQIFSLGNRQEHIALYKPLCLDTSSEEGILFEGGRACGAFNRTASWINRFCPAMSTQSEKEVLLQLQAARKSKAWLEDNSKSVEWVTGLTVLQVFEKNCGNIAHFSGRALLLQHIIENAGSYAAPSNDIANILILPTFHVMKRFLYPERYVRWHESLMKSLVAPAKYEIGDLGNFLQRSTESRKANEPLVQLLHNFSIAKGPFAQKKYVCFERALVPGYLKGRFFVSDIEYPSTRQSFHFPVEDSPDIPRDSLRLRERVSALLEETPEFRTMKKEIILIDRGGKRRIFDEGRKPEVLKAFEHIAKKHGYRFRVVTFEKSSFHEQYKAVSTASIAVGIHGANLVNTMFMPPLSVLIELFPYGFGHDMYKNGGNAGLKYYSYQMSTGKEFKGPKSYRSPEQCVRLNQKCKVHYRDAVLQVTDEDIANVAKILEDAVAWCDKLPAPSKSSGEPERARRRLLRHLLDAVLTRERHIARRFT